MGSFGERLRREREMRRITLDEIADATKIGTRSLRALEEEAFEKLPGGIFNKGFVRAYAKFLGINEEQAVADYLAAAGEQDSQVDTGSPPELTQSPEPGKKARYVAEVESSEGEVRFRFPWLLIFLIALIIGLSSASWHFYSRRRAQRQSRLQAEVTLPVASAAPVQLSQTPAPVAGTEESPSPMAGKASETTAPASSSSPVQKMAPLSDSAGATENRPEGGGLVLTLRVQKQAWVSITADGKFLMTATFPASTERTFRAGKRITIKTGNAGATEVIVNGKTMPSLGGENEVRTVTFTPDGILQ